VAICALAGAPTAAAMPLSAAPANARIAITARSVDDSVLLAATAAPAAPEPRVATTASPTDHLPQLEARRDQRPHCLHESSRTWLRTSWSDAGGAPWGRGRS
jgi:hypothetical protein